MTRAATETNSPSAPGDRWMNWRERTARRLGMAGPVEVSLALSFFILLILFKIANTARYKFNTDESQHLHVIWGWARGFVQYRDLCDNHMPLFQLLFAPIFGLIGDRPSILHWMRFILLPMYGMVVWCTYRIGSLLFSKRVGVWAVIMAGFYPGYHFCSLEFRTDNLWAPLWLLSILVLIENGVTMRAAWTAGILLGLCFGVSMKSSLLLAAVLVSGGITIWLIRPKALDISGRRLIACTCTYIGTALLIPLLIILAFVRAGVWPELRYWVFENNVLPGMRNHPAWWIVVFPITFPFVAGAARLVIKRAQDPVIAFRRGLVFLIWGFYIPAVWSFWPLVSRQDYLPYQPLAFVLYAAALIAISDRLARSETSFGRIVRTVPTSALVSVVFFLVALLAHPFWVNGGKPETDLLRATLQLTDPGDFVLDQKGETIFRQRAFRPIWEPLVMERICRGLLPDNAAERCVQTRACVATKEKDMSADATRFVEKHYLPVGSGLYVAGCLLLPPAAANSKRGDFEVAIPASYRIISEDAVIVQGTLDGTSYAGEPRLLLPGQHSFLATGSKSASLALLWAQAVERGFSPFSSNTLPHK